MTVNWEFISKALELIIMALLPGVLTIAGLYIKRLADQVQAKMGADNYKLAGQIVRALVQAAEQLGAGNVIADKKQWVLQMAEMELTKRGIRLDVTALSALIEGMVFDEFNWKKELEG